MRYKPSVFEQPKLDYSPLDTGIKRRRQKRRTFKKILKQLRTKVKSTQNSLAKLIRLVDLQKIKVMIIITTKAFYRLYRGLEKF